MRHWRRHLHIPSTLSDLWIFQASRSKGTEPVQRSSCHAAVMSFLIKPCRPVAQLGLTDKVKLINPGSASAERGSSVRRTV